MGRFQKADLAAIKDELTNDPAGRGYAGKDDAEQARLFTEPFPSTVVTIAVATPVQVLDALIAGDVITDKQKTDVLSKGVVTTKQTRLQAVLPTATEAGVEDVTEAKIT